jgi:hypothetical protein
MTHLTPSPAAPSNAPHPGVGPARRPPVALGLMATVLASHLVLAGCGGGGGGEGDDASPSADTRAETLAAGESYGVEAPADTVADTPTGTDTAAAADGTAPDATPTDTKTVATAADTPALLAVAAATGLAADVSVPGAVSLPNPTLENLTVEWAFTGDANRNATVSVRYRPVGTTAWRDNLPLRRIQAGTTQGKSWLTRHSGSVFNLTPGTLYELQLTLQDPDGGSVVRTATATTRAVPRPMAGAPIKPATPATFNAVMAAAQPGDIIELAAGTYAAPVVTRDGTATKPLVIRAAATAPAGSVVTTGELSLIGRKYVHVTGLTVRGRIRFNASLGVAIYRNTVNAVATVGNGDGIVTWNAAEDAYIADNTVNGTTAWGAAALGVNGVNRGEGILVSGPGHVVMNNRVRGFRDNISLLEDDGVRQYSIDILNNDLSEAADDGIEADFCWHNCRILRNRLTNVFIALSAQPSLGGPTYFVRNVAYNVAHVAFKLYRTSYGDVLLHNTVVKNGDGLGAYPGVPIYSLYSRNNLFIGGPGATWGGYSSGNGSVISLASLDVASSSLDFDALGSSDGSFKARIGATSTTSLADLRARTTEKSAVQIGLNAFAAAVAYPAAALTAFAPPDLRLRSGSAAADIGQVLPNINDGYTGTRPDAGAYEFGAPLPVYGPR